MDPIPAKPIRPLAKGSLRMQSDGRLLKLFRRGVEPAFDELVHRYRGALVGYAGAIAGKDRAEDVVQESLVKAHRSLSGNESIEPKPWLYTVVRNTALNDIRDNRKHAHEGLGEPAGRTATPHQVAEQKEELAAIVAAVSDLPDSQRRALIGHELGGYSHEEIATELKLTTGATKQLIYRARLTLRNAVGALIPFPLIAWLVSDTAGVIASGAGGASTAAGGAIGASSGGTAMGTAGGGGVMAAIAGAGGAKLAVVAVVAGGTIATGVAVEEHHASKKGDPSPTADVRAVSGEFSDGSGQIGSFIVDDAKASTGTPNSGSGTATGEGSGTVGGKSDGGIDGTGKSGSGSGRTSAPGSTGSSGKGSTGHVSGKGNSGSGSSGSGNGGSSGGGSGGSGGGGSGSGSGSGDAAPTTPPVTTPPVAGTGTSGGGYTGPYGGSGYDDGYEGHGSGRDSGNSGGSGYGGYSGGSGSSGSGKTWVAPSTPAPESGGGWHGGSGSGSSDD